VALAFGATLAAYVPAMRGGLLWDDAAHVTKPALQSLDGLRRIWLEPGATQQYYPLLHSAFWVEHRLWGDAVLGYHLLNILLHATAACLVMAIMRRLALPGAWLAGLIFALHPVNVESVAWISEQKNTLSAVFCLGSAYAYLGFDRDRRGAQYALALGLFVLALLTKTVTSTLPAALLVVLCWKRGRLDWRRDVLPLLPWLALGAAAGLFTAWVEKALVGAQGAGYALTWPDRFLLAGRVVWFYLSKLLWPADLMFIYPHWKVNSSEGWQYLFPIAALALAAGLTLAAMRARPPARRLAAGALAGFLIFAGTLFPAMGFFDVFPFVYSYVADHFQYLASLGVIVPLSCGLALAARPLLESAASRLVPVVGAAALLATLGALTWLQCGIYRDVQTLYLATIASNPGCWMAHANLGVAYSLIPGRMGDAVAEYQEALRLNPDDAEARNNLGVAWSVIPGRLDDAIAQYREALRIKPNFAGAHNNLGHALSQVPGRLDEAIAQYQEALRLQPADAETHNNLANAWLRVPARLDDAVAQCREAIRLDPGLAIAHYNLGIAYSRMQGRLGDAVAEYREAIRLKPDYAQAHNNLGNALEQMPGRLDDALGEYREAIRLQPDNAEAHYNLGLALAAAGRVDDAVAQYQEAIRLKPDYVEAHDNLGAALSAIPGRADDAVAEYREALRLDPGFAPAWRNLGAAWFNRGNVAEAVEAFQEALRLTPGSADAHTTLGLALARSPGRLDDAIAQYREALRLAPGYPAAQRALDAALARAGDR